MPAVARAFALFALLFLAGCSTPGPSSSTGPSVTTPSLSTPTASAVNGTHPVPSLRFTGAGALAVAREQVLYANGSVRYRIPGTAGNDEAAELAAQALRDAGFSVTSDEFTASFRCAPTRMHNVVALRASAASSRTVWIGAHYDSRPVADNDPDPANHAKPIQGANDGAAGVGVLVELARALKNEPLPFNLALLLFDGEDGGSDANVTLPCSARWALGSEHFAANMTAVQVADASAFILVDLPADAGLALPWELNSRFPTPGVPERARASEALQDRIYAVAGALRYAQFQNRTGYYITDDHVPFLKRGIPSVDLIDLRKPPGNPNNVFFPCHHQLCDDVDHLSANSMEAIGRTLERWLRGGARP